MEKLCICLVYYLFQHWLLGDDRYYNNDHVCPILVKELHSQQSESSDNLGFILISRCLIGSILLSMG